MTIGDSELGFTYVSLLTEAGKAGSLTADEAAQGCIEEIVVCSSSCDVEALADGLPPVPMSAWKSPCRKVCPCRPLEPGRGNLGRGCCY